LLCIDAFGREKILHIRLLRGERKPLLLLAHAPERGLHLVDLLLVVLLEARVLRSALELELSDTREPLRGGLLLLCAKLRRLIRGARHLRAGALRRRAHRSSLRRSATTRAVGHRHLRRTALVLRLPKLVLRDTGAVPSQRILVVIRHPLELGDVTDLRRILVVVVREAVEVVRHAARLIEQTSVGLSLLRRHFPAGLIVRVAVVSNLRR